MVIEKLVLLKLLGRVYFSLDYKIVERMIYSKSMHTKKFLPDKIQN